MRAFFRRKSPPEPQTFKERVEAFWRWFGEVGPRFHATIEAGKCAALTDETSAKVEELFAGFGWVYGPGAGGVGHSFTLTGEGNIHRQMLTIEWRSRAPEIEGWTFYAARQPGPIRGHTIELDGVRFDPKEIWVAPSVNTEREWVDLTVWHPAWERVDEKQRGMITFLFLDESLGEYGTGWWIGAIDYGKKKLAGAFPLEELADFVRATSQKCGWKKYPPGEEWGLLTLKEPNGDFPRGDVITQTTCVSRLFLDYVNASGEMDNPIEGTGADYAYVSFDAKSLPKGKEVDGRCKIGDAIEAALRETSAGKQIGGALGGGRAYCDFMIFDGRRSLDTIAGVLRGQELPAGTMIEFFAREKRGQRIAL